MRVHGRFKIRRRVLAITDWKKHKTDLEKDFYGICGYCGKHFRATFCESQIDHFIPKHKYPRYKNQYSNLVLACKVCNNKKRDDWPSNDPAKSITDDGKKGYVDPATDEFDNHLERCENGSIIGKTDVGKYMAKRLGFDYRPISEIHKIMEIYDAINILNERSKRGNTLYKTEHLVELFNAIEELRQQIHIKKE